MIFGYLHYENVKLGVSILPGYQDYAGKIDLDNIEYCNCMLSSMLNMPISK